MKKVLAYTAAIFATLLSVLYVAAAIFLTVTLPVSSNDDREPPSEYAFWQSELAGDANVIDVVLPGSHDAGTAGMANLMETQSDRLDRQLRFGARYFDVRPMLYKGALYPYHLLPNTFYPFRKLMDDVTSFLTEFPSEFVVLDFQHFDGAEEATKTMLDGIPEITRFAVPNTVDLASLTVGEMRENGWKLIVVWNESYAPADRPYLFERGRSLYSPYDGDAHKESDEALLKAFGGYYSAKPDGEFFVLQAQRTGKFGGEMVISKLEDAFRPKVNGFLRELSDELLRKTNIVMRDFITRDSETIDLILGLNARKGLLA